MGGAVHGNSMRLLKKFKNEMAPEVPISISNRRYEKKAHKFESEIMRKFSGILSYNFTLIRCFRHSYLVKNQIQARGQDGIPIHGDCKDQ